MNHESFSHALAMTKLASWQISVMWLQFLNWSHITESCHDANFVSIALGLQNHYLCHWWRTNASCMYASQYLSEFTKGCAKQLLSFLNKMILFLYLVNGCTYESHYKRWQSQYDRPFMLVSEGEMVRQLFLWQRNHVSHFLKPPAT